MLEFLLLALIGGFGGFGTAYAIEKFIENKKVTEFTFVKDQNILKILKKENISGKNQNCIVCDQQIRKGNIGMILSKNNQNYFTCKKNDCMTVSNIAIERMT